MAVAITLIRPNVGKINGKINSELISYILLVAIAVLLYNTDILC